MASETTSYTENSNPSELRMEIKRQYSYTTLARLIGSVGSSPQSPATPSPCGAVRAMKGLVSRLEEIDAESRGLLQRLFSMLESDARLEKYVRMRLQDPRVSRMWELVEQVLSSRRGSIDVDAMLSNVKIDENRDDDGGFESDVLFKVRGLGPYCHVGGDDHDEMRMDRFKIRTLDTSDFVVDK